MKTAALLAALAKVVGLGCVSAVLDALNLLLPDPLLPPPSRGVYSESEVAESLRRLWAMQSHPSQGPWS